MMRIPAILLAISAVVLLAVLVAGCEPIKTVETAGYYPDPKYVGDIVGGPGSVMRQAGNEITLTCTIQGMPAFSVARCVGGGFPYTVPAGKTFCLTHMYLQNKYPWEPPRYSGNMHAMYLQEANIPSASSHHPELHFNPPIPLKAGDKLVATVSNGQTEPQNIWAFEQGYLVDDGQPCR
jgi:predicted small secreted protein